MRWFLTLLLSLALRSPAGAIAAAQPATRGVAWVAHGQGGPLYLVGSVHILDRSAYPLPATMEKAYDSSSLLVVEVDLLDPEVAKRAPRKFAEAGRCPRGMHLRDEITPRTWEAVRACLGSQLSRYEDFQPWLLSLVIQQLATKRAGLDPKLGLDRHFLLKAHASRKPVFELEGLEAQIKLLSTFSPEEQEAMLLGAALGSRQSAKKVREVIDAWRKGDTATLTTLVEPPREISALERKYLFAVFEKRNIRMADEIAAFLEQGQRAFVIVGAGHLVGENGVVKLLQDRGYRVDPL